MKEFIDEHFLIVLGIVITLLGLIFFVPFWNSLVRGEKQKPFIEFLKILLFLVFIALVACGFHYDWFFS